MNPKPSVLFVDDEPNVLRSLERCLRQSGIRIQTAGSAREALILLEDHPFDVLVSDMRMPEMDGSRLLALARERWPDTVRLLLTGHADLDGTIRAINAGGLFGYLCKPWEAQALVATIQSAADFSWMAREKLRLQRDNEAQAAALGALNAFLETRVEERTAELEFAHSKLKRNYMASIKSFANLVELRGGQLVGHGRRVADMARSLARAMQCNGDVVQSVFVAGLLHDIGLIGMPEASLARPVSNLDGDLQALHRRHTALGEQTLIALDDMQPVAALIRSHHERFDGKGFPDSLAGESIPLGARILAVADHYDELLSGAFGAPSLTAPTVHKLIERGRGTQFDPQVLDALLRLAKAAGESSREIRTAIVGWAWLEVGMELGADLRSHDGALLLAADHVLTEEMIERIRAYARREAQRLELHIKCSSLALSRARATC